jgi:hypothetical protein
MVSLASCRYVFEHRRADVSTVSVRCSPFFNALQKVQGAENTLLRALDFLHIERTATPYLHLHRALSHSHNNSQAPTIAHRLSNGHLRQREAPHQRLQERQPARPLRAYQS